MRRGRSGLPEVLHIISPAAGGLLPHHEEDGGPQVQQAITRPAPHTAQGSEGEPQAHQP